MKIWIGIIISACVVLLIFIGTLFVPYKMPFVMQGIMNLSHDSIQILSPRSGTIRKVFIQPKDRIYYNQPLIYFKPRYKVSKLLFKSMAMYNIRLLRLQAELDGENTFYKQSPSIIYKTELILLKSNQKRYEHEKVALLRHIKSLEKLYKQHRIRRIRHRLYLAYRNLKIFKYNHKQRIQLEISNTLKQISLLTKHHKPLMYSYVFANATGSVNQIYVHKGEKINKGDPIVLVYHNNSKAIISAFVSAFNWHQLHKNHVVHISFSYGLQHYNLEGKIVKYYKESHKYKVEIQVGGLPYMGVLNHYVVTVWGMSDSTPLWQQIYWFLIRC